jgi:small nuclear ribonucleoprotein (snRNP)-like protein
MLIDKNTEKNTVGEVISIKLVNGDELIGKLVSYEGNVFAIQQPMAVIATQAGIKLVNAMFTVEPGKVYRIAADHVMLHNTSADQVADHYREVTTGIKTVRNESRIIV